MFELSLIFYVRVRSDDIFNPRWKLSLNKESVTRHWLYKRMDDVSLLPPTVQCEVKTHQMHKALILRCCDSLCFGFTFRKLPNWQRIDVSDRFLYWGVTAEYQNLSVGVEEKVIQGGSPAAFSSGISSEDQQRDRCCDSGAEKVGWFTQMILIGSLLRVVQRNKTHLFTVWIVCC